MLTDSQKKVSILSAVAAATVVLITLFIIVIVQCAKIAPLKKQRAEAQAKLEHILEQKENTKNAIEYIEGNKFIEEYAREVLGYGKEGEVKFVPKNQGQN